MTPVTGSDIEDSARLVAHAITAPASPGRDEAGGHVECLTEAVMGMTSGLMRIAEALDNVAEAIRESKP